MNDVGNIIARMVLATSAKNTTEMLRIAGLSSGAAGAWKRRGGVPDGSIAKVAERTGVSFEWLKTGEGEMRAAGQAEGNYLDPELARVVMAEIKGRQGKEAMQLTAREASRLEMIRDLSEEEQKQIEYEIMTAWVASRRKQK